MAYSLGLIFHCLLSQFLDALYSTDQSHESNLLPNIFTRKIPKINFFMAGTEELGYFDPFRLQAFSADTIYLNYPCSVHVRAVIHRGD
jgi:ABC-type antimicrobial peptide transport system permease subunit